MHVMAKLFIMLGIVLVIVGIAIGYAPWLFAWFGKLPGDNEPAAGSNDQARFENLESDA